MTNINFVLTLVDSDGVERVVTSSGDLATLNGSVLFTSRENAEKGLKKILLRLSLEGLARALYWYDEVQNNPARFVNTVEPERYIKQYKDYQLMAAGNIQIKEVLLQVQ